MKQTTVKLPEKIDASLRREAARRGITVSDLTREAIATDLGLGTRRQFLSAGAGRSGRDDISERIEEILREELAP